ncbi:MAG: LysM peptidoglycan-binding domain-containing protein [Planctomycetota bacterium]|jgi:LysM repeat protein|nr:LysM peptidoglycan-binding domain-containing protein [Planctomycetota bacterium]MDA1026815.1 LysM peptidoglycan-binding domain-containing protein [Planctomycetota bacterium]
MALASQSGRSTSRRSYMSSRRRSRRSRWILGILLIAIACVVGWWFTSESKTAIDPESSTAGDTEVSAPTENVASSSDSQIYFDDGRRAPNEAAKTTGTAEPDRTERPDPAKPTAAVNSTKGSDDSSKTAEPTRTSRPITSNRNAATALADALRLSTTDPVAARRSLTTAWVAGGLSAADRTDAIRLARTLSELTLLDRPSLPNNPYVREYKVRSGDSLERIAKREDLQIDKMLLARMNNLSNPNAIRIGQTLRLPNGTFDAIIDKSDYSLTLYQKTDADRSIVVVLPVGLGEFDATPTGLFRVRVNSKLVNPHWINPRTREEFKPNDPANPIGEHWIGLEGIENANRDVDGYGIHGTIDPASIGNQMSMGCVRMLSDDVQLVYEVLTHQGSTIEIRD